MLATRVSENPSLERCRLDLPTAVFASVLHANAKYTYPTENCLGRTHAPRIATASPRRVIASAFAPVLKWGENQNCAAHCLIDSAAVG